MNNPIARLSGYVPLIYLGDKIILGRLNKIYIADLYLKKIQYVCSVGTLNGIYGLFFRSRLLQRLLRLEIGPATPLHDYGCFLAFYRGRVFHVDIAKRVARPEVVPKLSKKPLQMLLIQSGSQKGSVLLGDYCLNPNYEPVSVYRRDPNGVWDIAFTFQKGEINHVHGIFEDAERNCLFILTGDFDQGACIWDSDLALKEVRPMVRKGQMSRACWILPWKEKLIFATDKQAELNYLCSVESQDIERINQHFPIVGSSIYFSSTHSDPIVFSTAVEPVPSGKITLRMLLSIRRAAGILSDNACVYAGNPEQGFDIIFSGKKDCLPFGLFQFGNIRFPTGISSDNSLVHFYCSALRGHDGVMYAVNLDSVC